MLVAVAMVICGTAHAQQAQPDLQPIPYATPKRGGGVFVPDAKKSLEQNIQQAVSQAPGSTEAAKTAQGAEKTATDAAKQVLELPVKAAEEALKYPPLAR